MFDELYFIGGMLLSFIGFDILFFALNKSRLKLFVPLQDYFSKVRYKYFLKAIIYIFCLAISIGIKYYFSFNYFMFGFMLGVFYAFINMLFKYSITGEYL